MTEECRGFRWIGQTRRSCDGCGRPMWDHDGMEVSADGPFGSGWTVEPWDVSMTERLAKARAAWAANAVYEERDDYISVGGGHYDVVRTEWRYGVDMPKGEQVREVSRRRST